MRLLSRELRSSCSERWQDERRKGSSIEAVEWVLSHRRKDDPMPDPVVVTLYGPDGEPLKIVHVPQGEGDAPRER